MGTFSIDENNRRSPRDLLFRSPFLFGTNEETYDMSDTRPLPALQEGNEEGT